MEWAAFSGGTSPPSPSSQHEITQGCPMHCCIWLVSLSAGVRCQKPPRNERRAPTSSPPHPMGHLKHVLIQKTLMVMEQDFRHPFSARSKVRSFKSSSLIFWMTDEALSPSLSQFLLPKAPSAWQQWLHSSACRSPKHTSLLITYSSIPRGLYSADELQLCN